MYTCKGLFVENDGLKMCSLFWYGRSRSERRLRHPDKTGPPSAKKAILIVYDIFGFSPQSLQGADLLAYGNEREQYQVYVPDLLLGQYAQHAWFPADTAEKSQAMNAFFQGPANPTVAVERIPTIVQVITKQSSNIIEDWAIVGKCWGGKVCSHAAWEWER